MPELIASGQLPLYDYNDAIIAGAAPVNPSPDTLWLDNSVKPNMMKRWDGLAWEPVGELDPTYSETITAIETTLANMADDGLLDYSDRQKLKEDIALITGATPADAATLPTGATLDAGTVGSYRRIRKAAVSAGMLTSHAAYTALATAYTTLSTFLNARTPKPWDVSLANKATPTPVDKATFRNAWLGYYNAEAALADETTATLSSGIRTLKDTTIPALENKALSEAEKSAIQTSLNLIVKEKSDLDATSSSYQSNANLIDKTLVSTPKTAYNNSYDALLAAMNDVLDEPTGAAIADAKITAVNTQFTDYGTKLAALRTGFQNAQKAIETKLGNDAETAISTALVDYVDKTSYGLDIQQIQNQVDGSIMTHFGANEPTLMNAPASAWSTTVDKDIHLGDLYYDTVSGFAYRFAKTDTVYNWMRIVDTDVTLALQNASMAQDTADAKRRAFYITPTPPYDVGDLWVQGSGGDLMRCKTAKAAGGSYAEGDWTKAVKYTDDTAAAAAVQAASDAQTDADTANTKLTEIASDDKLTAVEKQAARKEWNALTSQTVANSAQASTFGVSATNYQNAIAALGTYLNGGTALTYAQCTGGTIPLWIADANLGITTTIVGTTYRTTWKTYYDAQVALMNAIAAEAKRLANVAQETADNIQVGGRNWFKKTTNIAGLSGTTSTVKNALNGFTTTVSVANSSIRISNVFNENGTYTFSGYVTCTVSGTVQVDFADNAFGSFSFSAAKTKFSVTGKISNYTAATYHFIDLSGLPAGTYTFEDVKIEKGNRATDWSPAPEDINDQIAVSNTNINNLRQSLDSKRDIRLGMKLGFSAFSTVNANYIYFCGLGTNATTFAEELSDTDGSLYDRGTQTTLTIPKQTLNLTGLAAGTSGYLVWNSSDGTNKIWFITLQNTYDASGTMTASKWIKRNIGATGDNTEMVLTDAVYVLGELEI